MGAASSVSLEFEGEGELYFFFNRRSGAECQNGRDEGIPANKRGEAANRGPASAMTLP